MSDKMYQYMNWPEIEAVVYLDSDCPSKVLGQRLVRGGLLVQTYVPDGKRVALKNLDTQKLVEMERVEDDGYYCVMLKEKKRIRYKIIVENYDGRIREFVDAYAFEPILPVKELEKYNAGVQYNSYEYLGAHPMEIDGIKGVLFAVWAPMAAAVSVVGDFNNWDNRFHLMNRREETGIFELFIPGAKIGQYYKYEIMRHGRESVLKSDPYSFGSELRPNTASIIQDISDFKWSDKKWMDGRKQESIKKSPMLVYEVHLGSWKKPQEDRESFYNYRELAPMIADYVKEMGYTHIEVMPVMEHPLDASWGYQVTGYFAPTSRHGEPEDFAYFMNYMHEQGIGVILDWVPAHFPKDEFGLAEFDGTCLYEHADKRQGFHPHWGTLIYNYGRPEVSNFLISSALFWMEKYHADGIRMDAVASMLYLDYGKQNGEWIPNIYGGKENLEAIEFLKNLSKVFHKKFPGGILVAEESTAWPMVTGELEEGSLGFDYKWNMGWMNDFLSYMQCPPLYRKEHYGELIFSMIYAYSEKFMLVLSHDEVVHGKGSMLGKMPGDSVAAKYANLRLAMGYWMTHPGKKLLFMGQDFAQEREWSEERSLDWELLQENSHREFYEFMKALLRLYKEEPALFELEHEPEGFEWINNFSVDESIVVFARKSKKSSDILLVVCNFDAVEWEDYKIGVPREGKYKEIFNTDDESFGGCGLVNPRVKKSAAQECDGREHSIKINVPSLGMSIFRYTQEKSQTLKKLEALEEA